MESFNAEQCSSYISPSNFLSVAIKRDMYIGRRRPLHPSVLHLKGSDDWSYL